MGNFKNKSIYLWMGLFLISAISAYGSFWLWREWSIASQSSLEPQIFITPPETKTTSTLTRRPLDGVWVEPETASSSVFGAMIDNQPEARPPAGLENASLVWEAPVEGGVTRFLAIWPTTASVDKMGPVRSARPYFLDWIKEVNGLYLHVGGSTEALNELKTKGVADLNEYYRGWYFWRDQGRPRPHNVFTSSILVAKALNDYPSLFKQVKDGPESWPYQEEIQLAERGFLDPPPIDYGVIKVGWRYDRERNVYERLAGGERHVAASGLPIIAKNVIYLYTDIRIIDTVDRKEIRILGNGLAAVMRDGQFIEGEWRKASPAVRTRFFDRAGGEINLNAGPTWIEILDRDSDNH